MFGESVLERRFARSWNAYEFDDHDVLFTELFVVKVDGGKDDMVVGSSGNATAPEPVMPAQRRFAQSDGRQAFKVDAGDERHVRWAPCLGLVLRVLRMRGAKNSSNIER